MKVEIAVSTPARSAWEKIKISVKKSVPLFILSFTCSLTALAQHNVLSAGSAQSLTITNGTIFSADSLVLIPSADFTIASNTLLETPVAMLGTPTNSISRVYYLNNPITFSGSIDIYYQLSELNGNTESALKYTDSTTGDFFWPVVASSSVNTTSHVVQLSASNEIFAAVTATQTGTSLQLKLLSFTGSINGNNVNLTWTIDQNEESKNFTVESSADGQSWQEAALVEGSHVQGIYKYYYNDAGAALTTKFYRIMITALSGEVSYSPIIEITNGGNINNVWVAANNNSATIYFAGMQPKNIRVINSAGQIIYNNNVSRYQYDINNLLPGLYFVQYEINGITSSKKFVVL
jgi:hypothetical protein